MKLLLGTTFIAIFAIVSDWKILLKIIFQKKLYFSSMGIRIFVQVLFRFKKNWCPPNEIFRTWVLHATSNPFNSIFVQFFSIGFDGRTDASASTTQRQRQRNGIADNTSNNAQLWILFRLWSTWTYSSCLYRRRVQESMFHQSLRYLAEMHTLQRWSKMHINP